MEPENQPSTSTPPPADEVAAQPAATTTTTPTTSGTVVNTTPTSTLSKMGGNKNKLLMLVAIIVIVLLGASAAAYFGVIEPSKPDTKLRKSFLNLASKKQVSVSGQMDFADKKSTGSVKGFTADYTIDADLEKSDFALAGKVGINGAQFPFDLRSLDKDIYIKVGGLSSVDKLLPAGSVDPMTAEYLKLAASISDKWYVVDRSYLQQAGVSANCVSDISYALNKKDIDKIDAAYKKYPLFKVKNTSKEKVDGVETTKMELDPASDETANKFGNELTSLSVVSKVKACLKDTGVSDKVDKEVMADKENKDNSKIYAYVTNDKQLKKLEITADDETATVKFTMVFSDKANAITKPEGAKPIQELLSSLMGSLYGTDYSGVNGL